MSTSGRRGKLNYIVMTHPSLSPQPGIWGNLLGLRGRVVKMCQGGKPDTHSFYTGMNVCGSAYQNGGVVDGIYMRIEYYLFI